MTLKHFTAITSPFVRQLIAFTQVARRAAYYKVIRAIRPAARKRDDVICMIGVADINVTPITASLLCFILTMHICNSMCPLRAPFSPAPPNGCIPIYLGVFDITSSLSFAHLIGVCPTIAFGVVQSALPISAVALLRYIRFAFSTVMTAPILFSSATGKITEWFNYVTPAAFFLFSKSLGYMLIGYSNAFFAFICSASVFDREVLFGRSQNRVAKPTLYKTFRRLGGFRRSRHALFTSRSKPSAFSNSKKFRSRGQIPLAESACFMCVLGWYMFYSLSIFSRIYQNLAAILLVIPSGCLTYALFVFRVILLTRKGLTSFACVFELASGFCVVAKKFRCFGLFGSTFNTPLCGYFRGMINFRHGVYLALSHASGCASTRRRGFSVSTYYSTELAL